jgi:hypothetical protein
MKEDAIEITSGLACLQCMEQIGISPEVSLFIVLGTSTMFRLAIDWLRTRNQKLSKNDSKNLENQEK